MALLFEGTPLAGTVEAVFGDGATTIWIGATASPTNGADVIVADGASNSIDGKNGDDVIFGGGGKDTLKGGNGNDLIDGGEDRDALWGGNGNDTLSGGADADTVFGENGGDVVAGGDGNDRLEGGAGSDLVIGEAGNDTVLGGADADTLDGGEGADRLYGDGGGDLLILAEEESARDTIFGSVAHLADDTITYFTTGKDPDSDVIAITGLASKYGKLLDSLTLVDGVLSLSKVGGGDIQFDGLGDDPHYTDTMLGTDGSILLYII